MEPTTQQPKPTDWNKVRAAILKKYPNLTKTQLTKLDAAIKRRQTKEAAEKGLIDVQEIAKTDPGLAVELVNSGMSPQNKKQSDAAAGILGTTDELKRLYNQPNQAGEVPQPEKPGDLSFGEKGQPSILGALAGNAQVALNLSSDAKTYKRIKNAFAATLKELTGDTGVLTDQDFARLVNALPNFGDDDAAALQAWSSFDTILTEKLGSAGKFSYLETKKPVDIAQQQVVEKYAGTPLQSTQTTKKGGKVPISIEPFKENAYLKAAADLQQSMANSDLLPFVGTAIGGIIGGPIGAAAGAGAGVSLKASAKKRSSGANILQTFLPMFSGNYGQEVKDVIKAQAIAGGTTAIGGAVLRPVKTLTKIRDGLAAKNPATISGEKLAEAGVQFAEKAPTALRKPAQRLALEGIEQYGGKTMSISEASAQKTASNRLSFTLRGGQKATAAGQFEKAIGDALRQEIAQVAPGVSRIDKILSTFIPLQRRTGGFAGKAVGEVGRTAVLVEALKRMGLGRG